MLYSKQVNKPHETVNSGLKISDFWHSTTEPKRHAWKRQFFFSWVGLHLKN